MPVMERVRVGLQRESREDARQLNAAMNDFSQSKKDADRAETIIDKLTVYQTGVNSSWNSLNDLIRHYLTQSDERYNQVREMAANQADIEEIAKGNPSINYLVPSHIDQAKEVLALLESKNPSLFEGFQQRTGGRLQQASDALGEFQTAFGQDADRLRSLKIDKDDEDAIKRAVRNLDNRYDRTINILKKLASAAKEDYTATFGKNRAEWDIAYESMVYILDEGCRQEDYQSDRDAEAGYEAKITDMRTKVENEFSEFTVAWSSAKEKLDEHIARASRMHDDEDLTAVAEGKAPYTTGFHSDGAKRLLSETEEFTAHVSRVQETISTEMFNKALDAHNVVQEQLQSQMAKLEEVRTTDGPREKHTDSTPRRECLMALAKIKSTRWKASMHAKLGASPLDSLRLKVMESQHSRLTDVDTRQEEHAEEQRSQEPAGE